jgi:hypothetical protein
MLNSQSVPSSEGSVELDTVELYGDDPYYFQSAQHQWGDATGSGGWIAEDPGPDFTADFHRYGILIDTPSDTVKIYLDDTLMGTWALSSVPGITQLNWYLLVNLAMGGGWTVNPPPGGYYDMWIDYVRYYR